MSSVIRSVKNVTKGYSSVQVKVRNATSNDPWGPTGADMADISRITYNSSTDFYEVMDMLDKRLNDKGKNWRHVLKSLKVLDYCLHEGSELCVTWARKNIYIIRTLREFVYVDEEGRDVGQNIRVSAKELTSLIMDEDRLRAERANRHSWKSRVTGLEDMGGGDHLGSAATTPRRTRDRPQRANSDDDLEYKLALEASKNEAEEDAKRRAGRVTEDNDDDLAKALKLSREEDELRKRDMENQNTDLLFDDTPSQQPQPTGFNQGYQQQAAVDWFGNPMEQQQAQSTGFLNNAYSQPTGLQQQPTAFQNGYGYQQPGFDGYGQQQMQQQPQQQMPQATGYNPWATQMNGGGGLDHNAQQQQQQPIAQSGSNNPWGTSSPQQELAPQATGSNNPFASKISQQQQPNAQRPLTLSTLQEQKTAQQFQQQSPYNPITNYQSPQQSGFPTSSPATPFGQQSRPQISAPSPQVSSPLDTHRAQLNALLASGEGQDTFGNVGNTRIPAQHTAPGTFVNSAGQGLGKLEVARTGTNPFMHNQFTGAPQQQFPAQTGPVGGQGGSNPFGRPQQGNQGGSLIDL
ncbi:ENTH-domain-containing protein [Myriangium duriaei CBS 260.36]|uniref:ENTH-domain-containing protein n=1 Tax=Myriangium duriaei CBS 260.36 TaxID=1168546 RepID=A0A9P4MI34_9PEZI|nr:ENTH-domain-containing protein [Myriangium duriaei CBS 260.36]